MRIGIDEAGRGCVFGPIVVCGVLASPSDEEALRKLAVADSKSFGGDLRKALKKREVIAEGVRNVCSVRIAIAGWRAIDKIDSLDRLERALAGAIISDLLRISSGSEIVLDGQLFEPLREKFANLRAESKADVTDVIVSAASICAKNARDKLCISLMGEEGFFSGGGYPNAKTERWIRSYVSTNKCLPVGIRRSWSWCKRTGVLQLESRDAAEGLGLAGNR